MNSMQQVSNHKIIGAILNVCARINNGRTLTTIMNHAEGEMVELKEELSKFLSDQPEGKDGVVGEAIDVMLCMVDLIYTRNPTISKEHVYSLVCDKLEKWEKLYSNSPVKEEKDN